MSTDVALESTPDADINTAVDAAYRAKYPNGGSATTTMVTPPAAGTTVRLLSTP